MHGRRDNSEHSAQLYCHQTSKQLTIILSFHHCSLVPAVPTRQGSKLMSWIFLFCTLNLPNSVEVPSRFYSCPIKPMRGSLSEIQHCHSDVFYFLHFPMAEKGDFGNRRGWAIRWHTRYTFICYLWYKLFIESLWLKQLHYFISPPLLFRVLK